ncbi:ATP-binding cassette domain-containing protein [Streptomyces sp. NPDC001793]|uniref:ATP-binding cassette domain-containing protein n=1 Tax=Streptomyces sp. NPDC001793 TaxID=3154657 RepID=UPI00331D4A7B
MTGGGTVDGEVLQYVDRTGSRERAARQIRLVDMARRLPQLVRRSVALAWRTDRWAALGLLLCQVASGAMQALGLLAVSGTLTALLTGGDLYGRLLGAWPSVVLLAAAAGVRAALGIVVAWLSSRLGPQMSREAELRLLQAVTEVELSAYDAPGFTHRKEAADRGAEIAQDLVGEGQDLIASVASLAAGAGVLTALHPALLPLLMLASLPQAVAQVGAARVRYLARLRAGGDYRLLSILRWHVCDRYAADQVRAGTMADFLVGRYRQITERINRADRRAADTGARMSAVGAVCGGLASTAVWGAVVWLLATGRMSVGHAGTAVFALQTVGTALRGLVAGGARIMRTGLYMDDWSEFLAEAGGFRMSRGTLVPAAPREIRVQDLVFRYEEAARDALRGVSFTLRRGEVVALVGYNGSGKTTLAKLLSGLYLPTTGAVTWDGVPTGDLDPQAMWSQVALVPQDYARWPLTARENITLGRSTEGGDADIHDACARSGADEVLTELRSGLDTVLARDWLGGQELSGGQWQRIALTRAFHRPAGLLVLDEPTSALDPLGEHRIFAGLREIAATRAVVLITHRLTNVAVADRILVMDKGQVVQHGTFPELVAQPGLFRDLWAYQHTREVHRAAERGESGVHSESGESGPVVVTALTDVLPSVPADTEAAAQRPVITGTAALLVNKQGQYLLHLRDAHKEIRNPGTWSLPGGAPEAGETPYEALARELREEAELVVPDLVPFALLRPSGPDGTVHGHIQVFLGHWNGDAAALPLTEGVLLHWFDAGMLPRLTMCDWAAEAVRRHQDERCGAAEGACG